MLKLGPFEFETIDFLFTNFFPSIVFDIPAPGIDNFSVTTALTQSHTGRTFCRTWTIPEDITLFRFADASIARRIQLIGTKKPDETFLSIGNTSSRTLVRVTIDFGE